MPYLGVENDIIFYKEIKTFCTFIPFIYESIKTKNSACLRIYNIWNQSLTKADSNVQLKRRLLALSLIIKTQETFCDANFMNPIGFLSNLLEIIRPTYVFSAGSRSIIGRFVEIAGTYPLVNSGNDRSDKFT